MNILLEAVIQYVSVPAELTLESQQITRREPEQSHPDVTDQQSQISCFQEQRHHFVKF